MAIKKTSSDRTVAGRLKMLAAGAAGAALLSVGAAQASDNITVFTWSGYEDPGFTQDFVAEHGKEPNFTFFGDEEEAFQKLMAGFEADVSHPCSQSITKWRDAGVIEPWDVSRIPAFADLNPDLTSIEGLSGRRQCLHDPL